MGENTFIYGKNLGEHVRTKIKLMEQYRHHKPRIDKDILWRPAVGQPWPEGFPTKYSDSKKPRDIRGSFISVQWMNPHALVPKS